MTVVNTSTNDPNVLKATTRLVVNLVRRPKPRLPMVKRLCHVMEINGVKVYAHWSVLLIGCVVLMGAISEPSTAIPGLLCYYGVILLHECGHMVAAQRRGYPPDQF